MFNNKIRVQDDLYKFVNQEWIDNAVIPDDKPTAGGFSDLAKNVEELMMKEFNNMSDGTTPIPNNYLKNAIDLYNIAKDIKRRNKEGIRPALKRLANIKNLKDITSFNRHLKSLVLEGYPLPLEIKVDADMKNTNTHSIYLFGPSTILPDTAYYKEGMEAQKQALLGVWKGMVKQALGFTRLTDEEQNQYIQDALEFDELIASLVKSSEEWSEYTKMYNPMQLRTVAGLVKPIKLRKVLVELFGEEVPETLIVAEPRYVKGFSKVFNDNTFDRYKHWAYIHELLGASSYLSTKIREVGSLYSRTLSGVKVLPSIDKQAYNIASSVYSEPVGLYYGEKYFGEEAKKDVIEMVHEIIDTYKDRIKRNDFLAESTKEKAILKLDKMAVKMGYPDKVHERFDKIVFTPTNSLYAIMQEIKAIKIADSFSKLGKPLDRTIWAMPGHMVNACFDPFANDITFPAAILQAPFYSIKQSRSENLGGIGAVIGHEISHAFDNNGSHCDEFGNLNDWWCKEDFKKFEQKTKLMIKQFDGIELEWGKVNGSLVVSENIADNGGMAVTLEIMSKMPNADYKGYFYNWARVWCLKARPEYLQLLLSVDVHSPAYLRANITPRNFTEWYDTFNVKKSDGMYIAPNKRIIIW